MKFFLTVFLSLPMAAFSAGDTPSYRLTDGRAVAPLEMFQECDQCPEMIVLPLGSFMMGGKLGESRNPYDMFRENATLRRRAPDEVNIIPAEMPRHKVEIDIPFAMGRNEVTNAEWMACVAAKACAHIPDHWVPRPEGRQMLGPNHPAVNLSYLDMLEYVAWLNNLVGAEGGAEVYRLPTEAEWEYSARAGTQTRFAQGEELTTQQANFSRRGTEQLRGVERPDLATRVLPVPVDTLDAANGWGLRHMSGNVREMTQSCWTTEHLGLRTSSAYLMLTQSQAECLRTSKGGSFTGAMDYSRLAGRGRARETFRTVNFGFRVVRQFRN